MSFVSSRPSQKCSFSLRLGKPCSGFSGEISLATTDWIAEKVANDRNYRSLGALSIYEKFSVRILRQMEKWNFRGHHVNVTERSCPFANFHFDNTVRTRVRTWVTKNNDWSWNFSTLSSAFMKPWIKFREGNQARYVRKSVLYPLSTLHWSFGSVWIEWSKF